MMMYGVVNNLPVIGLSAKLRSVTRDCLIKENNGSEGVTYVTQCNIKFLTGTHSKHCHMF